MEFNVYEGELGRRRRSRSATYVTARKIIPSNYIGPDQLRSLHVCTLVYVHIHPCQIRKPQTIFIFPLSLSNLQLPPFQFLFQTHTPSIHQLSDPYNLYTYVPALT